MKHLKKEDYDSVRKELKELFATSIVKKGKFQRNLRLTDFVDKDFYPKEKFARKYFKKRTKFSLIIPSKANKNLTLFEKRDHVKKVVMILMYSLGVGKQYGKNDVRILNLLDFVSKSSIYFDTLEPNLQFLKELVILSKISRFFLFSSRVALLHDIILKNIENPNEEEEEEENQLKPEFLGKLSYDIIFCKIFRFFRIINVYKYSIVNRTFYENIFKYSLPNRSEDEKDFTYFYVLDINRKRKIISDSLFSKFLEHKVLKENSVSYENMLLFMQNGYLGTLRALGQGNCINRTELEGLKEMMLDQNRFIEFGSCHETNMLSCLVFLKHLNLENKIKEFSEGNIEDILFQVFFRDFPEYKDSTSIECLEATKLLFSFFINIKTKEKFLRLFLGMFSTKCRLSISSMNPFVVSQRIRKVKFVLTHFLLSKYREKEKKYYQDLITDYYDLDHSILEKIIKFYEINPQFNNNILLQKNVQNANFETVQFLIKKYDINVSFDNNFLIKSTFKMIDSTYEKQKRETLGRIAGLILVAGQRAGQMRIDDSMFLISCEFGFHSLVEIMLDDFLNDIHLEEIIEKAFYSILEKTTEYEIKRDDLFKTGKHLFLTGKLDVTKSNYEYFLFACKHGLYQFIELFLDYNKNNNENKFEINFNINEAILRTVESASVSNTDFPDYSKIVKLLLSYSKKVDPTINDNFLIRIATKRKPKEEEKDDDEEELFFIDKKNDDENIVKGRISLVNALLRDPRVDISVNNYEPYLNCLEYDSSDLLRLFFRLRVIPVRFLKSKIFKIIVKQTLTPKTGILMLYEHLKIEEFGNIPKKYRERVLELVVANDFRKQQFLNPPFFDLFFSKLFPSSSSKNENENENNNNKIEEEEGESEDSVEDNDFFNFCFLKFCEVSKDHGFENHLIIQKLLLMDEDRKKKNKRNGLSNEVLGNIRKIVSNIRNVNASIKICQDLNFCTIYATGNRFKNQLLYRCLTCQEKAELENSSDLSGTCICDSCRRICHRNHKVNVIASFVEGYCDCSSRVFLGDKCLCTMKKKKY